MLRIPIYPEERIVDDAIAIVYSEFRDVPSTAAWESFLVIVLL